VKPASPDFEHSFDAILRNLADNGEWKEDKSLNIEIEVRAIMSGGEQESVLQASSPFGSRKDRFGEGSLLNRVKQSKSQRGI
jgi:hypothetical protein